MVALRFAERCCPGMSHIFAGSRTGSCLMPTDGIALGPCQRPEYQARLERNVLQGSEGPVVAMLAYLSDVGHPSVRPFGLPPPLAGEE